MNTSYPLLPLGPPFNMSNFDYQIINYQITFITKISSKLFDHVYALQYFTDISYLSLICFSSILRTSLANIENILFLSASQLYFKFVNFDLDFKFWALVFMKTTLDNGGRLIFKHLTNFLESEPTNGDLP